MKIKTKSGVYHVDLRDRICEIAQEGFGFYQLARAYVGSKAALFLNDVGDIIFKTDEVVSVEADPNEAVSGEEGNVVFLTQNSTYEVNQELKLYRRLAGLNTPTVNQGLDGDWQPYTEIIGLEVGQCPVILRPGKSAGHLTHVREIRGNLVSPPHPESLNEQV